MKLNEWIEKENNKLVESKKWRSVIFKEVEPCKLTSCTIGKIFNIGGKEEQINMDINVQEVNKKEINGEIDAIEVIFDVVKPRCRKPERLRLYVQEI